MRVEYIKAVESLASEVGVISSGGERTSYLVLNSFFDVGSLFSGSALDEGTLDALIYENERYRATRVALKLLKVSDHSRRALYNKLLARGYSSKLSRDVVNYMVACGYIDEEGAIKELILTLANKSLYGEEKILPRLLRKSYDLGMCERIFYSLVESGEVDLQENARLLIEKKLPDTADAGEIQRLLYRFGYKIREYEDD